MNHDFFKNGEILICWVQSQVGFVCMCASTGSGELMAALIGSCSDGDWVWLSLSQW